MKYKYIVIFGDLYFVFISELEKKIVIVDVIISMFLFFRN